MSETNNGLILRTIRAKCAGTISGLKELGDMHKIASLDASFARDYNSILSTLRQILPTETHGLLPPEAKTNSYGAWGSDRSTTTPAEYLVYYQQLNQMLGEWIKGDK